MWLPWGIFMLLGFFRPSCLSHWLSKELRRLVFLVLYSRVGAPSMWLDLITPQEGSLFSSVAFPRGLDPDLMTFLLFLPDSL